MQPLFARAGEKSTLGVSPGDEEGHAGLVLELARLRLALEDVGDCLEAAGAHLGCGLHLH
jgi:hypothetical protein